MNIEVLPFVSVFQFSILEAGSSEGSCNPKQTAPHTDCFHKYCLPEALEPLEKHSFKFNPISGLQSDTPIRRSTYSGKTWGMFYNNNVRVIQVPTSFTPTVSSLQSWEAVEFLWKHNFPPTFLRVLQPIYCNILFLYMFFFLLLCN